MTTPDPRKDRIDRIISQLRAAQNQRDSVPAPGHVAVDLCDDQDDTEVFLKVLLTDVAETVGTDFLDHVPLDLLEQFCMMSVVRNESTGLLLRHLILGFMRAYAKQETSDQAIQALLVLEHLGDIPQSTLN